MVAKHVNRQNGGQTTRLGCECTFPFTRCSCRHFSILWLFIVTFNDASLPQRQLTVQATQQCNAAVARLRHIRTRINRRRGRMWRNSGRTEQWWLNLFDGILPEREWKKNLRMDPAAEIPTPCDGK